MIEWREIDKRPFKKILGRIKKMFRRFTLVLYLKRVLTAGEQSLGRKNELWKECNSDAFNMRPLFGVLMF